MFTQRKIIEIKNNEFLKKQFINFDYDMSAQGVPFSELFLD